MKTLTFALVTSLVASIAHAEGQTADQLVAAKRHADMTYRQLMEVMGTASAIIQDGLVRENAEMARMGADVIADHPAPNHKPWTIMAEPEQDTFKQALLSYDKVLDNGATRIAEAAAAGDLARGQPGGLCPDRRLHHLSRRVKKAR